MITGSDLLDAAPVIASLVVIESLLSVDNALGVAALAAGLPEEKQKVAMRLGIAGAYVFRGVAMGLAAWIVHSDWIRGLGAVYLIYLTCEQLAVAPRKALRKAPLQDTRSDLVRTVVKIELLDLSLSLDNVVAAVAMSRKLWVVCTGVFIGILALRFLAGFCLRLLERFPILGKTAFLLVGWVGLVLSWELAVGKEVPSAIKFAGIGLIVTGSMFYGRSSTVQFALRPLVRGTLRCMAAFAAVIDVFTWPLRRAAAGAVSLFKRPV